MGIFQPGGAGTRIFLYDDNDPSGGHAAGQAHTPAEINAFNAVDFALMQDAVGNTFSGVRDQYLVNVPVRVGGDVTDGTNPTSFLIKGCDVFVRSSGVTSFLEIRSAAQIAQNLITINMGTKTGDRNEGNLAGVDGGSLFLNGNMVWTCNLGWYGSLIVTHAQFVFNNSSCDLQEIGGCLLLHNTSNASFSLGIVDNQKFFFLNSVCGTTRSGVGGMFNNFNAESVEGSTLCTTSTQYFINSSSTINIRFPKMSGTPALADLRLFGPSTDLVEPIWSNYPPVRVISGNIVSSAVREYWRFDTKVVDLNGTPISGVPVFVSSDVDAAHLSGLTQLDGNLEFSNPSSGVNNAVHVRDWYGSVSDGGALARDRLFTITVNGYEDPLITPNPNYKTIRFKFEWPGRDQTVSGYATDGGTFQRIMMPIRLPPGAPSRDPLWTECEVI